MRKIAFLVGNDTFPKDPSIPPLRFTQNDARELAEVLEDPETCGFETNLYLNRSSQDVMTGLEQLSGELGQDDTLLFYYSGHGKLRQNELCLVSNETVTTILGATSIRTRLVLEYLQGSLARRRILILDCCHSGAISSIYKAVDSKSALDGLAHSFGSYILTASTAIQLAEEREKDGHGVFTKALIDCLREGGKDSITVDDWYEYAYDRLSLDAKQTPVKWGLRGEGPSFEIGNFKAKHERERREALNHVIATARTKFDALQAIEVLTQGQVDSILHLLECNEATLFPHDQAFRANVIRYLNGEVNFASVFARVRPIDEHPPPSMPEPPEPEGAVALRAPLRGSASPPPVPTFSPSTLRAKTFISYSRDSQDIVEELVQDLHDDGHETWFDQRLTGGRMWWDMILSEIRKCDIFVAALTPDFLESRACLRELNYAGLLQKPVLPVRLSDKVQPEALPHGLAELQWVDYCRRDKLALKMLQRTIRELPKAPMLPDPLPDPPAVPMSYMSRLREQIETDSPLDREDQVQLVFELRSHFRDGGRAEEIIDLLQRLKKRDELLAKVSRDIDELRAEIGVGQSGLFSSNEREPRRGSTSFTVVLTAIGDEKIEVIKAVRGLTGLSLKEAKDLVEAAPKPVKEGATKEEAQKIKIALEKAGAKVEFK